MFLQNVFENWWVKQLLCLMWCRAERQREEKRGIVPAAVNLNPEPSCMFVWRCLDCVCWETIRKQKIFVSFSACDSFGLEIGQYLFYFFCFFFHNLDTCRCYCTIEITYFVLFKAPNFRLDRLLHKLHVFALSLYQG